MIVVGRGTYQERVVEAIRRLGRPATRHEIRKATVPHIGSVRLDETLRDLEQSGILVRGVVKKFGADYPTWGLVPRSEPANRIEALTSANGNGSPSLVTDKALINMVLNGTIPPPVLDHANALSVVEDILLGIEALRIQAQSLDDFLRHWPSLSALDVLEQHCKASGKELRATICREILPVLVNPDAAAEVSS